MPVTPAAFFFRLLRRLLSALVLMALGAGLMAGWLRFFDPSGFQMMRTTEALRIYGPQDDGVDYRLPAGTVLYFDQAFAEGHVRYRAYFNHKGPIAHEPVEMKPEYGGRLFAPLWLETLTDDSDASPSVTTPH